MNHFERMAIFTLIENVESQLKGLKTLLAASANGIGAAPAEHKVTRTHQAIDSEELSEEDEDKLQETLELARTEAMARATKQAEAHFQAEWQTVSKKPDETLNG